MSPGCAMSSAALAASSSIGTTLVFSVGVPAVMRPFRRRSGTSRGGAAPAQIMAAETDVMVIGGLCSRGGEVVQMRIGEVARRGEGDDAPARAFQLIEDGANGIEFICIVGVIQNHLNWKASKKIEPSRHVLVIRLEGQ